MHCQPTARSRLDTEARRALQVAIRLRRERPPQSADRDPHRRRKTPALQPVGRKIVEVAQITFGGLRVLRHLASVIENQYPWDTLRFRFCRGQRAEGRRLQSSADVRGESPEERHLTRVEILTTAFPDEVDPTPLLTAHGADRQRLVAQT